MDTVQTLQAAARDWRRLRTIAFDFFFQTRCAVCGQDGSDLWLPVWTWPSPPLHLAATDAGLL